MKLVLTAEQSAAVTPSIRPGTALLGRILPEPFDGSNGETCGRLCIELGTVSEAALPALRAAIMKSNAKKKKKP